MLTAVKKEFGNAPGKKKKGWATAKMNNIFQRGGGKMLIRRNNKKNEGLEGMITIVTPGNRGKCVRTGKENPLYQRAVQNRGKNRGVSHVGDTSDNQPEKGGGTPDLSKGSEY